VAVLGLARSHPHLGRKELARADYETLKERDPHLAERLRREFDRS